MIRVCVLEPREGAHRSHLEGADAKGLSEEMAKRRLENGTLITAIAIFEQSEKSAAAIAERQNCDYRIDIYRDETAESFGDPGPGIPLAEVSQRPVISCRLWKLSSGKKLWSGIAAYPRTVGQSHIRITPYPHLADTIVKKLNHETN